MVIDKDVLKMIIIIDNVFVVTNNKNLISVIKKVIGIWDITERIQDKMIGYSIELILKSHVVMSVLSGDKNEVGVEQQIISVWRSVLKIIKS